MDYRNAIVYGLNGQNYIHYGNAECATDHSLSETDRAFIKDVLQKYNCNCDVRYAVNDSAPLTLEVKVYKSSSKNLKKKQLTIEKVYQIIKECLIRAQDALAKTTLRSGVDCMMLLVSIAAIAQAVFLFCKPAQDTYQHVLRTWTYYCNTGQLNEESFSRFAYIVAQHKADFEMRMQVAALFGVIATIVCMTCIFQQSEFFENYQNYIPPIPEDLVPKRYYKLVKLETVLE